MFCSVPVSTKVLPLNLSNTGFVRFKKFTPDCRSFSICSKLCGSAKKAVIESTSTSPTPSTAKSSSFVAFFILSSEPNFAAKSFAVFSPILKMPMAKSRRGKSLFLLCSIAFIRFCALFSFILSSASKSLFLSE